MKWIDVNEELMVKNDKEKILQKKSQRLSMLWMARACQS